MTEKQLCILYIHCPISWISLFQRSNDAGKHGGLQQIVAKLTHICRYPINRVVVNRSFHCYRSLVTLYSYGCSHRNVWLFTEYIRIISFFFKQKVTHSWFYKMCTNLQKHTFCNFLGLTAVYSVLFLDHRSVWLVDCHGHRPIVAHVTNAVDRLSRCTTGRTGRTYTDLSCCNSLSCCTHNGYVVLYSRPFTFKSVNDWRLRPSRR